MVDSLEHSEEEMFESDDVVRGLSQKHEETAPALSCHTCGEEIYSEEFIRDEKLYCSEECMERESSAMSVDTTRRRVRLEVQYTIGHYASCTFVVVLVFMEARCLLFMTSILLASKSLRIFNITNMATERSQRAMLNGQYWVFKTLKNYPFRVLINCWQLAEKTG